MGIVATLRRAVTDEGSTLYECRNCGETLSKVADECHCCGAEDIACYRF